MRRLFALTLILLAPSIYAASTYLNLVDEYTTRFETSESDLQPFASTMIFKWQTVSPDIKFNLDTAGNDWNLDFWFGMYDPQNNYFSLPNISFDSFTVELGGVEGDGFSINSYDHSTYGIFNGNGFILSRISGKGSFTSISFALNFGGVPLSPAFAMVPYDFTSATPYSSFFRIYSGSSSITVIPEPSALSLLAVGLGGLAMIRRRLS